MNQCWVQNTFFQNSKNDNLSLNHFCWRRGHSSGGTTPSRIKLIMKDFNAFWCESVRTKYSWHTHELTSHNAGALAKEVLLVVIVPGVHIAAGIKNDLTNANPLSCIHTHGTVIHSDLVIVRLFSTALSLPILGTEIRYWAGECVGTYGDWVSLKLIILRNWQSHWQACPNHA